MLDPITSSLLVSEALILFKRALNQQTVNAFGVDGFGIYGQSTTAKHFKITNINVQIDNSSPDEDPDGILHIELEGYDCHDCGHILTDKNFEISFNNLLEDQEIDTKSWKWYSQLSQGRDFVTLRFNFAKLLEW